MEVDAEEVPAFSMLPKGDPLKNPIAQQPIDDKDTASKTGKKDNAPTEGATEADTYRILESWNHMLDEEVSVGKKRQKLIDQAGIKDQKMRVLDKKMSAIKTAADQIICDDTDMKAEGASGSETRGLFEWAKATAQSVKPVDELYRTPSGQISTAKFDEFYEETFQALINTHFDATGRSGNFIALAGIYWKQRVSNWSILSSANATENYIRRFTGEANQDAKVLNAMVNVLDCDGGRIELHKSRNLLWDRDPSARQAYSAGVYKGAYSMIGWHVGCAELRFGWEPDYEPLGKTGPGDAGSINMDFAVCADPTGLIKHVPASLT